MNYIQRYGTKVGSRNEALVSEGPPSREIEFGFGGAELPTEGQPRNTKRMPRSYSSSNNVPTVESSSSKSTDDSWFSFPPTSVTESKRSPKRCADEEQEISHKELLFCAKVVNAVGKCLKHSITTMDADTLFCVKRPSDLMTYIRNLIYTEATAESFIISILYLKRYLKYNKDSQLAYSNVQLLYLTSLTVAIKYNDDSYFSSAFYAEIGGLDSVKVLNRLELVFLFGLNFDLGVDSSEYKKLEDEVLGNRSKRRSRKPSRTSKDSNHFSHPLASRPSPRHSSPREYC